MFWPIVSSTGTTLCAFLPMLFWPGMPGQFMRYLPITLIFVLTASLLVALIYMPITGIILARSTRFLGRISTGLRRVLGWGGSMLLAGTALFGIATILKGSLSAGQPLGQPETMGLLALAVVTLFAINAAFARRKRAVKPLKATKRRYGIYGTVLRFLTSRRRRSHRVSARLDLHAIRRRRSRR